MLDREIFTDSYYRVHSYFEYVTDKREYIEERQACLWNIIENSKIVPSLAPANAITILNKTGYPLKEKCLEKINIAHANLKKADLSHANLKGANLSHVTLIDANLE